MHLSKIFLKQFLIYASAGVMSLSNYLPPATDLKGLYTTKRNSSIRLVGEDLFSLYT